MQSRERQFDSSVTRP
nr:unnamed protein product [Callosobruchus chinensis]CAH7714427.1 unnamed protein product [Callosobruchus chinensis]CAH7720750.1 unnamed protein product [Callosobruchus chinensis]CAH7735472.1 unnamed protein product [Callosobruchus chinensis]CAH7744962.1 unnamed protein product [Callosobruchus chinensis]